MESLAAPLARTPVSEVDRLKARDADAWSAVFEREYPLVYRSVLARTRNGAVAEDVASQVFVEAIAGIDRYRERGRPIGAWLMTIARNRAADWFRKQQRERGSEVEPTAAGPEAGLTIAVDALGRLTADQREVVHLRFVEGFALEEVAARTGRSVTAVKALQHRAIARLRTVLGDEGRGI
ncbi:MAG: RNA polymerase sigma factor [Dehalococcoidia bacterium]